MATSDTNVVQKIKYQWYRKLNITPKTKVCVSLAHTGTSCKYTRTLFTLCATDLPGHLPWAPTHPPHTMHSEGRCRVDLIDPGGCAPSRAAPTARGKCRVSPPSPAAPGREPMPRVASRR